MAATTTSGTSTNHGDLQDALGYRAPTQAALDDDDHEIQPDPDEGDRQERGEHERDVEQRPAGEVDEDAETALGPGPLADDRADDGERDPTRIPPRIDGRAAGISSVVRICRRVARSERPSSRSRASTERIPTIVAIATGKKTISAQMTTLPRSPGPNHRAMSGARARIGVACAATRYGDSRRSTNALRARA